MRHGDSAHGGHCRARGAKKFLKIFKKRGENPKNGVPEVPGGGAGAPYIERAGRFLNLETRPLAALLKVRFVQVSHLQAPAWDVSDSLL